MINKKPIILCILDGYGLAKESKYNAISKKTAPTIMEIFKDFPFTKLCASSGCVGLPKNTMGNSEVGHLNMGAGRIVKQILPLINDEIKSKKLEKNKDLVSISKTLISNHNSLHLLGLFSKGNVHSNLEHTFFLAKYFACLGIKVKLHLIGDGRDVATTSLLKDLQKIKKNKYIEIATLSGRYYAMDRNNNINRTKKYFETFCGVGSSTSDFKKYVKQNYKKHITDEFILPIRNENYSGPDKNDILICTNFRADRMRQIMELIIKKKMFKKVYSFTSYKKEFDKNVSVIFPSKNLNNTLSQIISEKGLKQFHIAETEKYAHVTFFFNGEKEIPYKNEDRILIPSPDVKTYDLSPKMSAEKITKEVVKNFDKYDFILINYANLDMIGHTGNIDAARIAVKEIDNQVKILKDLTLQKNATLLITADHGNAEDMKGAGTTTHSKNPVPFCIVSNQKYHLVKKGVLGDIAPTILQIMKIKQPKEMTGKSLIKD